MAFGEHWEWRAFGPADTRLPAAVEALPALRDAPWQVMDRYLWTPGCTVNVKLRDDHLKFKRFVEARRGLERWLEDEAEVFAFPLEPAILALLVETLGVTLVGPPPRELSQDTVLALLQAAHPPAQLIDVAKTRRLRELRLSGDLPDAPATQVELTRIHTPEPLITVALEHPTAEAVLAARQDLGLDQLSLKAANYLDVLAVWAKGGTVL